MVIFEDMHYMLIYIYPRCFCILADKPTVLNPNFFPPLVWTYPDDSVGALHLAAARPCDLRVPRDCVAEWRFMSRKQKNYVCILYFPEYEQQNYIVLVISGVLVVFGVFVVFGVLVTFFGWRLGKSLVK